MNKVYAFVLFLFSVISNAQFITVDTSTHTPFQLVNNVLVNSPCVNVNNVTSSTGSNFGSTNGIGYFQNTNPDFPLANGVVLTTGNVLNAPGPNTTELNDGSAGWLGDAQLEATLLAAGISMNSRNASFLEFEFTSFSTSFNFQFVFASEEYGNFQCLSPDGFAFLLTDTVTGITQNIAVVPSTTTPISVRTVRDQLYNSACNSVNPSYFGAFNGGSNAASSATNFNGQTILMNAGTTLVPNRTYRLKLVIADGNNDTLADSAIFIGGSSFDFTQDVLGPDLTIANGTALCNNNGTNISYTITSGLDPNQFDFIWKDALGNPIPGETGPNLTINQPGTYLLTYFIQSTGCEVETNDIIIEYQSTITTPNPSDLYICNNGSANYTYDLSFNNTIIDPSNVYTLTYHDNVTDANNGTSPLSTTLNTPAGSLPREVWIRVLNPSTGCYTVKSFFLRLTPSAILNSPGNQTECETTPGSGQASFDLASLILTILGAQSGSIYNVSFHTTPADAITDTSIINTTSALVSGNTTIGIRIENITDQNCFSTSSIDLIVKARPQLDLIPDQLVCIQYILPPLANPGTYYDAPFPGGNIIPVGTAITTDTTVYIHHSSGGIPDCENERSFEVNVIEQNDITPSDITACDTATIPNYPQPTGTQYFSMAGGPSTPGNVEYLPGQSVTTVGTTTIYVYFTFTDPTCPPLASSFDVTIIKSPTVTGTFQNIFSCTPVNSLPPLTSDIGTPGYYTFDGVSTYTPLTLPITTTTEVYAFAENLTCRSTINQFTVFISGLNLPNINLCSGTYTLTAPILGEFRDAPNGGGNIITTPVDITTNTRVYHYISGASCTNDDFFDITFHLPNLTTQTDVTRCASYTLPANPDGGRYFTLAGGPNTAGNTEYVAGNNITTTTTLFIYKESTIALVPVCYYEIPWTITINPQPPVDSRSDITQCYDYTLSPLTNGSYFDNPYDPNNPGAHVPITDFIISVADLNAEDDIPNRTKILYIANINPNDATCYSESTFRIEFDGIEALDPADVYRCNTFTLPTLPANMFYYDTPLNDTDISTPHPGSIIPAGTTYNSTNVVSPIYIYTSTNNRLACEDENSFTITIFDTPVITPPIPNTINACDTYTLQPLTIGKYYTMSGGPSVPGNTEIFTPITYDINNPPPAFIYVYAESGDTTNIVCPVEQTITINLFNVTELPDVPAQCGSYQLNPTALQVGENYYSSPGGIGLLANNATISSTQTIYIYRNFGTCSDESDFIVNIVPRPIANTATIAPICDNFNVITDGLEQFDLTQVQSAVLGSQTPVSDFTFSYYESSVDATNATNAIPTAELTVYENDNPFTDSVWVRISNTTTSAPCFDIIEIPLRVYATPNPTLKDEYFICNDYTTGTTLNPAFLDCGISGPQYNFAWTKDGQPYGGNTPTISPNEPGNYTVTVTDTSSPNACNKSVSTKVTAYAPYITIDYSDAFDNPTYITVTVNGAGSGHYEYQIDSEGFQDSNTFYNVTPGEHTISVRDKDGHCSPAPLNAVIVNYPKFFTPNGDGYNETWNIKDLESTNPNAPIYIFDRMGKFLKQISPSTSGWDGTHNGKELPATDYWFTVEFNEKGNNRLFRAHFSLKR